MQTETIETPWIADTWCDTHGGLCLGLTPECHMRNPRSDRAVDAVLDLYALLRATPPPHPGTASVIRERIARACLGAQR